ncbi:MAG: aminotransferase class I/II-fold pyridoxal phosphate-dependent enzyme [Merdibacter sp.]
MIVFMKNSSAFARQYDIAVLHDNAYSELVFDGPLGKSFLSYPGAKDVGVELNSFSKTYGMAGARLGVLVGNAQLIEGYKILKSNMDYGIFLPIQKAGVVALNENQNCVETTRQTYIHRRNLMVRCFRRPDGDSSQPATMFYGRASHRDMRTVRHLHLRF